MRLRARDAAKTDVARRRVDRFGEARGGAVAPAIVRRTEKRSAFQDLPRDAYARRVAVDALAASSTPWISWVATSDRRCRGMARAVPIGGPLPYVANHIVQPETIRR